MRRQSRGPRSTCASGGDTTSRGRKVRGKEHVSFPAGCGRGGVPAQGPEGRACSLCPQSPSGASPSPRCTHRGFNIHSVFPKLPGQERIPVSSQSLKHWMCHLSSQQAQTGSCAGFCCQVTLPSLRLFLYGMDGKALTRLPSGTCCPWHPRGMPLSASRSPGMR